MTCAPVTEACGVVGAIDYGAALCLVPKMVGAKLSQLTSGEEDFDDPVLSIPDVLDCSERLAAARETLHGCVRANPLGNFLLIYI